MVLLRKKYFYWPVIIGCAIIALVMLYARLGVYFPLQIASINANLNYTSTDEVESAIGIYGKSSFFSAPLSKVRDKLLDLPWVEKVQVNRVWPDKLSLLITEHSPIARFNEGMVIGEKGSIITSDIAYELTELPLFLGSKDRVNELVSAFRIASEHLKPLGYSVLILEMMRETGWRAIIKNNVGDKVEVFLYADEFETELKRMKVIDKYILQDKISQIAYLDLRYTNGVAVGWNSSCGE